MKLPEEPAPITTAPELACMTSMHVRTIRVKCVHNEYNDRNNGVSQKTSHMSDEARGERKEGHTWSPLLPLKMQLLNSASPSSMVMAPVCRP